MEAYLDNMMIWVKEVYRVLKPTGSFVLNIGDCVCGGGRGTGFKNYPGQTQQPSESILATKNLPEGNIYKQKQLLSVSSFAYCKIIQETEFVCRGEHLWLKPNCPSPIRRRLKHAHEKLFWFVKDAERYYFDNTAWMRKFKASTARRYTRASSKCGKQGTLENMPARDNTTERTASEQLRYMRLKQTEPDSPHLDNVNLSDTSRYRSGHGTDYLTAETTIESSWRIIPVGARQNGFEATGRERSSHVAPYPEGLIIPYIQSLCPDDGIVLDPFLGSGTTMHVCVRNKKNCIGIELDKGAIFYAKKRLNWGVGFGIEYRES